MATSIQQFRLGRSQNSLNYHKLAKEPKTGKLHQVTYNYNKYGYDPKAGTEITSAPTQVKGSENRVVYKRPNYDTEYEYRGEWGRFNYTVEDNEGRSYNGTVVLVQPSLVIVGSDFLFSDEGWTTTGNRNSNKVTHDPTSRGKDLNHFIYAADDSLNVDHNGYDVDKWEYEIIVASFCDCLELRKIFL